VCTLIFGLVSKFELRLVKGKIHQRGQVSSDTAQMVSIVVKRKSRLVTEL